jgi:hypothetical protein
MPPSPGESPDRWGLNAGRIRLCRAVSDPAASSPVSPEPITLPALRAGTKALLQGHRVPRPRHTGVTPPHPVRGHGLTGQLRCRIEPRSRRSAAKGQVHPSGRSKRPRERHRSRAGSATNRAREVMSQERGAGPQKIFNISIQHRTEGLDRDSLSAHAVSRLAGSHGFEGRSRTEVNSRPPRTGRTVRRPACVLSHTLCVATPDAPRHSVRGWPAMSAKCGPYGAGGDD